MIKFSKQNSWLIVIGLTASFLLVFFSADSLGMANALLAIAIIWVGVMPTIFYLNKPKEEGWTFPLMPLTGIFYGVFFGVPAFSAYYLIGPEDTRIQFYTQRFVDSISLEAQALVLAGIILMLLTWVIGKRYLFLSMPIFTLPKPKDERSYIFIAGVLALASLAYLVFPEIRNLPSIGQLLQPAGFLAFAIFYLQYSQGKLNKVAKGGYFFVVLPVWIGCLIAVGSITPVLLFFVLWLSLRVMCTRSVPIFVAIVPLFICLIYPSLSEYRHKYWYLNEQGSVISKLFTLGSIVTHRPIVDSEDSKYSLGPLHGLVRRASLILPLSWVVETTIEPTSYWGGETYQTLFTGWIPRIIWRDKPKESWGNVFGRKFDIIPPSDTLNSINIPWITEMYANFGRAGVLLGMAFVGLFLGFLDRFLNSSKNRLVEQAVGAAVLLPLFFQESNFTLMTGSLLPLIFSYWLLFSIGLRIKIPWIGAPKI